MGIFRKPLTEEEQRKKQQYEESKIRLMDIHNHAETIFYIDEIAIDSVTGKYSLIGEMGKGQLKAASCYDIYSNEGLPVGTMQLNTFEDRDEQHFIVGKVTRTFCFPEEEWDGYSPGQMLIRMPDNT